MLSLYSILVFILYELPYIQGIKACDENSPDEPLNVTLTWADNNSPSFRNLCPAETKADIDMLNKLSTKYFFEWRYCLFQKTFKNGENKSCQTEMKPAFSFYLDTETKEEKKCGPEEKQYILHYFGYFYCGRMNEGLEQIRNMKNYSQEIEDYHEQQEPDDIPMYDVCYDKATLETIYTSHKVLQPSVYQEMTDQEQPYCPKKISTEAFYMNLKSFSKIERYYREEKNKNKKYKNRMSPYPMVPPTHFYYRTWKKPTNHYINMAPLLEQLIPLMTIIDEVIKKAANEVFQTSIGKKELRIFTKVVQIVPPKKDEFNIKSLINTPKNWLERKSNRFQPNIWYKFLYNETPKEGIMIYIHNTPEPPIIKKCNKDKIVECDFHKLWSDYVNSNIPESILKTPILSEHAYCCQITTEEVKEIFSRNLTIENVLNFESIFTPQDDDLYVF